MTSTPMRTILRDQRGFTLAEIVIAIGILGIGLLALSAAIPFASYGIQEGNQLSTATFLANQRLEQVRNARWETGPPDVDNVGSSLLASNPPKSGLIVTFPDETPMAAPYANYSRIVRIRSCGLFPCGVVGSAEMRQVTVTVSYRPMTGVGMAANTVTKDVAVTMYLAKR